MADGKLTLKQRLFVEAYLGKAKGNASEAARLAGYKGNAVTLGSVGAENLKKPQIAEMLKDKLSNKLKVLSADEVLEELTSIASAPWGEFIEVSDSISTYRVTMRLNDKLKAIELLGKYHKLFTEKVEHSGSVLLKPTININASESATDKRSRD